MTRQPGRESFARSAGQLVGGNVAASALTAVLVLALPRFLTMADYGYWQLYFFYATYLGYLSFGLADGIFIRFSGARLEDIPAAVISGHLRALLLVASTTLGLGSLLAWLLLPDATTPTVISLACLSTVFYLLRSLLTFTHQAANRAELLATTTVLERLVTLVVVAVLLVSGQHALLGILLADVAGRLVGFVYAAASSRRFLLTPPLPLRENLRELGESFRGGIFVSISAIATVLVTAIGRLAAERGFGIEVFGQVALAFSLVNIVLTVVTPISLAVLPNIRRQPRERLPAIYARGLDLLMPVLVLSLAVYVPLAWGITWWLPAYSGLPVYLGVMLPLVIFESRTRLFAIPFLQGIRRERSLAAVNVASLALALVTAWASVVVLHSILATVLSVTVAVVVRGVVLEGLLARRLALGRRSRTWAEVGVSALFVVAASGRLGWSSWVAVTVAWVGYLFWCRPQLAELVARLSRGGSSPRRGSEGTSSPL